MPVIRDFSKGVRRVLKRISFGNELFLLSFRRACISSLSLSLFILDLLRTTTKRFILGVSRRARVNFFFFFSQRRSLTRIFVVEYSITSVELI